MSMSRARAARRIAAAAAYGGGGIGLLGGAALGLLLTEVALARRVVGGNHDTPPQADGRYGSSFVHGPGREPLVLGMLGDSTAAGKGVHRPRQTPGALLATGLAAVAERAGGPAQRGALRSAVLRLGAAGHAASVRSGPDPRRLRDHDRGQ
ncbi:hypothetical protein GCM10020221_02750 [Streptomyces thioluteus]|uniref:SGNH/GDSL hydrolase family protein n=1 Tax=Streptomyces thioluteus TaxID=66431 RepID=A0ABN3WCD3_STRTU